MTCRLRPASPGDAAGVATLLGALGYPTPEHEVPARLDAVRAEGGDAVIAVDPAGAALGLVAVTLHASLTASRPVGYVTALVVAPAARGRGVGRMLLAGAERWARERGCGQLSLTSAERRSDAHLFYPRCGLPYTGRRFSKPLGPDR